MKEGTKIYPGYRDGRPPWKLRMSEQAIAAAARSRFAFPVLELAWFIGDAARPSERASEHELPNHRRDSYMGARSWGKFSFAEVVKKLANNARNRSLADIIRCAFLQVNPRVCTACGPPQACTGGLKPLMDLGRRAGAAISLLPSWPAGRPSGIELVKEGKKYGRSEEKRLYRRKQVMLKEPKRALSKGGGVGYRNKAVFSDPNVWGLFPGGVRFMAGESISRALRA